MFGPNWLRRAWQWLPGEKHFVAGPIGLRMSDLRSKFSDPNVERQLSELAMSNGFLKWMNLDLVAAGQGRVVIRLPVRSNLLQHHGFVHGGLVGTLVDTACGWAAASLAGDVVTQSYTIQLLAPAKGDVLRVESNVIKASRRNVSAEARVYMETEGTSDRLIATGLAMIAILNPAPREEKFG